MQCQNDPPLFDLKDNATAEFFGTLIEFSRVYTHVHRYLCLVVCLVGIVLNTLHFFVLSRRPMRTYIINALLCAMAICDALTMLSYLIYILRFRIFDNDVGIIGYSYPWLVFLIAHVTSSIALHTCSLYLSVTMAYIRWTALDRLDAKWINNSAIKQIFFLTAFSVTFISIPTLMVHKIVSVNDILGTNDTQVLSRGLFPIPISTTSAATPVIRSFLEENTATFEIFQSNNLYTVTLDESDFTGCTLFRANLWITGIFFKAVPCVLLLWFTIALIWKLCEMSEKRRQLRGDSNNNKKCTKLSIDKTTLMLIIMLVMLDLLSLVNCLTSFVLYCCMSSTYRATVYHLLMPNKKTPAQKTTLAAQSLKLLIS
ncbi:unnamed protein product [Nippostrongylus brasiliensis]|uniref:G_PROTEIN_RECEP_F1_2 domain-containing protein n=1 Tax=Nippostrongylus brasiliensis TaxID=27835 RepID=A0A0N4XVV6_NIPBR|nr:unnamed protein product [Nippostrongylus brasiliensis]